MLEINAKLILITWENLTFFALVLGNIKIQTKVDGVWHDGTIYDVLFVPELGTYLFSIGQATDHGFSVVFHCLGVSLINQQKIVATGVRIGRSLNGMNVK